MCKPVEGARFDIGRKINDSRAIFWTLVGIALFLRIAAAEWMLTRIDAQLPDTELYRAYAQRIYRGEPYAVADDGARRTPGYPGFMALSWRAAGHESDRFVLWAQGIVSTVGCLLVFCISRGLEDHGLPSGTAIAALLLAVLDPYSIVLATLMLSETLFGTLLLAAIFTGLRIAARFSLGWSTVLGVICGLAVLVRPSGILLVPLAAGCWWYLGGERRGVVARNLTVASLACIVTLSPWWIRNVLKYGRFIPTTLNVGESLYDGLNPNATGASDMRFRDSFATTELSEVEADRYWREAAQQFAIGNPALVLDLARKKFVRFWSPWPNEASFQRWWIVAVTTLFCVPVALMAFVGAWSYRTRAGVLALCVLPAGYFCSLHMVFVSSVRYRVPVHPLLCILAAAGLMITFRRWSRTLGGLTSPAT